MGRRKLNGELLSKAKNDEEILNVVSTGFVTYLLLLIKKKEEEEKRKRKKVMDEFLIPGLSPINIEHIYPYASVMRISSLFRDPDYLAQKILAPKRLFRVLLRSTRVIRNLHSRLLPSSA